ncbi:MAG: nucleotidyltransferase domain-containing protein [Candidatus Omnitrophica bacterium]|nr:nucleotidyltransferase domain-containing protein [Candidatus Omnitrophota bacterium]
MFNRLNNTMQFHQPINAILNDERKVKLLRFLCRKGGQWSGRRLADELSLNPVMTHRALRALHQATILDFRKVGASFVYSLREDHYLVQELLKPLFAREAAAKERLRTVLRRGLGKELSAEIVSVALYGSLARGEERPMSDIDVFILVRSAKGKPQAQKRMERVWTDVTRAFGNSVAPYIQTAHEAQQKSQQQLAVFQSILKDHELLWGQPLKDVLDGRATS